MRPNTKGVIAREGKMPRGAARAVKPANGLLRCAPPAGDRAAALILFFLVFGFVSRLAIGRHITWYDCVGSIFILSHGLSWPHAMNLTLGTGPPWSYDKIVLPTGKSVMRSIEAALLAFTDLHAVPIPSA
jgi:hypothetical protein